MVDVLEAIFRYDLRRWVESALPEYMEQLVGNTHLTIFRAVESCANDLALIVLTSRSDLLRVWTSWIRKVISHCLLV